MISNECLLGVASKKQIKDFIAQQMEPLLDWNNVPTILNEEIWSLEFTKVCSRTRTIGKNYAACKSTTSKRSCRRPAMYV